MRIMLKNAQNFQKKRFLLEKNDFFSDKRPWFYTNSMNWNFFHSNAPQKVILLKNSQKIQSFCFSGEKVGFSIEEKVLFFFEAAECCPTIYKCLSKDFLIESSQSVQKLFFRKTRSLLSKKFLKKIKIAKVGKSFLECVSKGEIA